MAKRLTISGRVQGVGYRASFYDKALSLGLYGWVRNCRDGTVEACVDGEARPTRRPGSSCQHRGCGGADSSDVHYFSYAMSPLALTWLASLMVDDGGTSSFGAQRNRSEPANAKLDACD